MTKIEKNGISQIQSQNICVGDILCVEDGDEFPSDILLLSSSNPTGKVTIMTANLDGETNLKTHSATNLTRNLIQPQLLNNLNAQVSLLKPLYNILIAWDGVQQGRNRLESFCTEIQI